MALQPLHDYVLVREQPKSLIMAGGYLLRPEHIPDPLHEPILATVDAVGPGRKLPDGRRLPLEVRPGDRVILSPYARIDTGDEAIALVRADDILARIEE